MNIFTVKRSPHSHMITGLVLLALLMLMVGDAWSQTAAAPTRTQCKQWDDAYLSLFNYAFWGSIAATFALSWLAGFLGKFFWFFTAPRLRIVAVTAFCFVLATVGVALGPSTVGLGHLWFGGVDPRYFECEVTQFGAAGFFDGLVGSGVPAIAQWPIMMMAFALAAILGGVLAWLSSDFINKMMLGVPAKVKLEAE